MQGKLPGWTLRLPPVIIPPAGLELLAPKLDSSRMHDCVLVIIPAAAYVEMNSGGHPEIGDSLG